MQRMLQFAADHKVYPVIETLPIEQVDTALQKLEVRARISVRSRLQLDRRCCGCAAD